MSETTKTTIFMCQACRHEGFAGEDKDRPGKKFAAGVADTLANLESCDDIELKVVDCLGVCKRPCTVSFCAPNKFTYVIGDLHVGRDEQNVIDFALLYGSSKDGITPWRERPKAIRKGTVARIPPINTTSSLVGDVEFDEDV